jgi:hypothetical protein
LDPLNAAGTEVNVIVEACNSGSFIDQVHTVSRQGRTVIASTGPFALAYATQSGALFSDALLNALWQAMSLKAAFEEGRWAAGQAHSDQTPLLDANGNGVANEPEDMQIAAQRSFSCAAVVPKEQAWPPHIVQVHVTPLESSTGEIWAQVQDDAGTPSVWAVVYPPSYEPPESSEVFEAEPTPVLLQSREDGWYSGLYDGFHEGGDYRIVVFAQDVDGPEARPKEHQVHISWRIYLPLVLR